MPRSALERRCQTNGMISRPAAKRKALNIQVQNTAVFQTRMISGVMRWLTAWNLSRKQRLLPMKTDQGSEGRTSVFGGERVHAGIRVGAFSAAALGPGNFVLA